MHTTGYRLTCSLCGIQKPPQMITVFDRRNYCQSRECQAELENIRRGSSWVRHDGENAAPYRTIQSGERSNGHKLTRPQVDEIRRLYQGGGYRHTDLAGMFGVSQRAIGDIITGTSWASPDYIPPSHSDSVSYWRH